MVRGLPGLELVTGQGGGLLISHGGGGSGEATGVASGLGDGTMAIRPDRIWVVLVPWVDIGRLWGSLIDFCCGWSFCCCGGRWWRGV